MMTKTDYHYTASGLDNVILKDLTVITDDSGEECVRIPNINGLHRALLLAVVTNEDALTPKELKFVRTELGLTQAALAALVDKDGQTVGRWERGEFPIEANADTIVRGVALDYLGVGTDRPAVSEIAGWSKVAPSGRDIVIDATNPDDYRLVA